MSLVKKITVSNLKALSNLEIDFNGSTAIITGGNNKGKTTFLRSLPDRLRGIKPDIILKQGETEGRAEWELTTGEKFVWTFDDKTKAGERLTFITTDNIKSSVTKEISEKYFPGTFDVDKFLQDSPGKQRKTLQNLCGLDFTDIDARYKAAYDDRTYQNKKLAELKAVPITIDKDLPEEVIPANVLQAKILAVNSTNLSIVTAKNMIGVKQDTIAENNEELENLAERIALLNERNENLHLEITDIQKWLKTNPAIEPPELLLLQNELIGIEEKNQKIVNNNEAKARKVALDKVAKIAADADILVKDILIEKDDLIKSADMPTGFGFTDDGITYNGLPFSREQSSSSAIYIAALKLAAMSIGEVRTLHFDASFLDKDSLAEIEAWATGEGLQLLIERADFEAGEIEYQIRSSIDDMGDLM